MAELARQSTILSAWTRGGPWQGVVGREDGIEVEEFQIGWPLHFFFLFLRAAASFWLSCFR